MFNTSPHAMRSSLFALTLFFAGFGAALAYAVPWLWLPYSFVCAFLMFQTFTLAYVNERFSRYATTMMIGRVALVAFLGVLAVFFVVRNEWGYPPDVALVACLVFAAIITAVYLVVRVTKASSFPFEVKKGRVASLHVKVDSYSTLAGGLSAGGAGILVKLFSAETVLVAIAIAMFSCCVFLIAYSRNIIRGLRVLSAQERLGGCVYTFDNVEEVRHVRSQWVLGRLASKLPKGTQH